MPREKPQENTYVVHDDDLSSSQELLRDDETTQCIADTTSGISNHMGVTFFQAQSTSGIYHSRQLWMG